MDMYLKSFRKSLTSFLKTRVRSKLSALGTDIMLAKEKVLNSQWTLDFSATKNTSGD